MRGAWRIEHWCFTRGPWFGMLLRRTRFPHQCCNRSTIHSARYYRVWAIIEMTANVENVRDVEQRLRARWKWRYLRWLAAHPDEGICRSERWRTFWRTLRRWTLGLLATRLVTWVGACVAVCGVLVLAGAAVAGLVAVL